MTFVTHGPSTCAAVLDKLWERIILGIALSEEVFVDIDQVYRERCKILADYFLEIFEEYWSDGEVPDRAVQFALYSNNLAFNLAFAVEYGHVNRLSHKSLKLLDETLYRLEMNSY